MAEFSVKDKRQLNNAASQISNLSSTVSSVSSTVSSVRGNYAIRDGSYGSVKRSLGSIIDALNSESSSLRSLGNNLDNIANKYQNTEDKIVGNSAQKSFSYQAGITKITSENVSSFLLSVATKLFPNDVEKAAKLVAEADEKWAIQFLNSFVDTKDAEDSVIGSLLRFSKGDTRFDILGITAEDESKFFGLLGESTLGAFLFQAVTGDVTRTFSSLKGSYKSELEAKWDTDFDLNDKIKDWLEKKGLRDKDEDKYYHDKDGNKIKKEDTDFYEEKFALFEAKDRAELGYTLYEKEGKLSDKGKYDIKVGDAEVYAEFASGLYVMGKDGKKTFAPGIKAEMGGSATAFEATAEYQFLGDENLGLSGEGKVTVGEVSAKADTTLHFISQDGEFDPQAHIGVEAEAIAAKAEVTGKVNVMGGDVGGSVAVQVGIGGHADIGLKDGKFSVDISGAIGIGAEVKFELDVGGMIDGCSSALGDLFG